MTGAVRVLLVDDQALIREGLHRIVDGEPGLEVVGEARDGAEAIDLAARLCPDVVVMDIRMPHVDGIEATRRIVAAQPASDHGTQVHVLILTTFGADEYVFEALQAGASGFMLKDAPAEQLVEAIRVVAAGSALLDPAVTRAVIAEFARRPGTPTPAPQLDQLTSREREVLVALTRGRSNAEIAAELFVTEATVKTHVAHLLLKLGVRDRVQAVILAYESGLVLPGDQRQR